MTIAMTMNDEIDVTPSPRVLRMLGEIDFKAWQCLCEIIDNSIDSFSSHDFQGDVEKQIKITLPSTNKNDKNNDKLLSFTESYPAKLDEMI